MTRVTAAHFGVILSGYTPDDEFDRVVEAMGATSIRWPGGTLAEVRTDVYDLSFPDLFDATALYGDSSTDRRGLSDLLAEARVDGASFSLILPTVRYAGDPARAEAEVAAFLERLADGEYGALPPELTLEIGNEYFAHEPFKSDPAAYGEIADAVLGALDAARPALEAAGTDLRVAVQMGKTAADNAAILDALGPEALGAVDAVVAHALPINLNNLINGGGAGEPGTRFERTESYLDAWTVALGREPDLSLSAWTVGEAALDPADVDLAFQDYGARAASTALHLFGGYLAIGADDAALWGVDAPNLNTVGTVSGSGPVALEHVGAIFSMLSGSVIDHDLALFDSGFDRSDLFGHMAFEAPGRLVVYSFVNEIDGDERLTLNLAPFDLEAPVRIASVRRLETEGGGTGDTARLSETPLIVTPDQFDFASVTNGRLTTARFTDDFQVIETVLTWAQTDTDQDGRLEGTRYDDTLEGGDGAQEIVGGDGGDLLIG